MQCNPRWAVLTIFCSVSTFRERRFLRDFIECVPGFQDGILGGGSFIQATWSEHSRFAAYSVGTFGSLDKIRTT